MGPLDVFLQRLEAYQYCTAELYSRGLLQNSIFRHFSKANGIERHPAY